MPKGLIGIIVILAGLTAGYFASRALAAIHVRIGREYTYSPAKLAIPDPSVLTLSSIYVQSKDQFQKAVNQGADAFQKAPKGALVPGGREIDLLRLLDYYRQFFLHYYRWLDTGNMQSSVQYKLALGQFMATLDYFEKKYADNPFFTVLQLEEFRTVIRITEQTGRTVRWAKLVVVILIFLMLMGIPRLIRVKGYKKYAASLYYDSVFRPNFISDLNAWYSVRQMAFILVVLYLFSMVVFSSFISWKLPLIFASLGLTPVLAFMVLFGTQRRLPEKLISLMAPKIMIVILVLAVVAIRGPIFFWYRFWTSEIFRLIFLSILFILIFRKFHIYMILSRQWSHRNRIGSAAMDTLVLGLQFLLAAGLLSYFGTEESLTSLNREVLLFPGDFFATGALRIFWLVIIAGILTTSSLIFCILNRKRGAELSMRW